MEQTEAATDTDLAGHLRPGIIVGGKFALLREIGSGGTGVVYEAEDTWIGRRVALKVLHPHTATDPRAVVRFEREARAQARIQHPNIVAVHEVGKRANGSYFIVQELLEGTSLRDVLVERGRLDLGEALSILVPIMDALVVAHGMKIVHRDIKPDNIFLARGAQGDRLPKLIDFGIAKIESGILSPLAKQTEDHSGTPFYMSPEQAHGRIVDARADVWAMGAVLFELLAGASPFDAPTGPLVLARIVTENPPRLDAVVPGIDAELATIVERAMARDLEARTPSMRALLESLLAFADARDVDLGARPPKRPSDPGGGAGAGDVLIVEDETGAADPLAMSGENRAVMSDELRWSRSEESDDAEPSRPSEVELEASCVAATEALRVNALNEATSLAEDAIARHGASGETRGRMRLVQAIALRWQGQFARAEQCAAEARAALAHGSTGWHAAMGHLAMVLGYVGKGADLPALADELLALDVSSENAAHAIAACRFTIVLMRTGSTELAERLFGRAQLAALGPGEPEPVVLGWMDLARAELAIHAGDPTEYLMLLESAAARFAEAGDLRNACLQRANVGNAYLQLGAYARAEKRLREALTVGEPMGLSIVTAARSNLGIVLARLGRLDEAERVETAALAECVTQGTTRYEAYSRIALAEIHAARGELAKAEAEARAASRVAAGNPSVQAMALSALGELLLRMNRAAEALTPAKEAMDTLELLDGVEEGESLIRLVYVLALDATNRKRSAAERLAGARMRLLERAQGITDLELRRSFMEDIVENRRTLDLCESWGLSSAR